MNTQLTLENEDVLDFKVEQSTEVIKSIQGKTDSIPLMVMFSGGKDSLVLLDLVSKVTDNFRCCYTNTGFQFPGEEERIKDLCHKLGVELHVSYPKDYQGDIFQLLEKRQRFPNIISRWCSRDLKIRPLHKLLRRIYGKVTFYKLNGVRRYESTRRNKMHISTQRKGFIIKDWEVSNAFMVFPILNWTDEDVLNYISKNELELPTESEYKIYGVSGCYWCPFYQASIYKLILKEHPNLYDRFIDWEIKLDTPSVNGYVWLRDLKEEVVKNG